MGEVYRARDSALRREVAIKVLPAFYSQDPDRLGRFEQEAQAAAALNHPNILVVYQFGSFEGAPYLVSELLEGSALRQTLEGGALPVRKAIDIGVQIAHGLAAAHDKGIVHRDLKPENLFVTKNGRVKILDFGLAKLKQPQQQPDPDGLAPTQAKGTEPGMVMGTAGYMAPEQVRGNPVDHRADIFAFGAILYEMLAGRRAFQRSTSAETMTAILNDDPPAVSQLAQSTPPGLQRVVHRCLEKSPEQRFQSASDLAFALEAISESGISAAAPSAERIRPRSRKPRLWSGSIATVLALAAAAYYLTIRQHHLPFEHYSIEKVIDSEHVQMVAISPDGAYVAAVEQEPNGNQTLIIHHVATGSERPIVQETAYKYQDVTFSPDGNFIYFRIDALGTPNQADLYRIPVLGGQATRIVADVDAPVNFIARGQRLCIYRQDPTTDSYKFLSASVDGGDEQVLATGKKPYLSNPVCAPNGRFAVFADLALGLQSLDFASGSKQVRISLASLGEYADNLHWAPDGKDLFAITSKDFSTLQLGEVSYPRGNLRNITNDLLVHWGISLTSDARTMATIETNDNDRFSELSLIEPSDIKEHQIGGLYWFNWLDNNRIVGSSNQLKIIDLTHNQTTPLNIPKGHMYFHPSLCGRNALVVSDNDSDKSTSVSKVLLDGGAPRRLTQGPVDYYPECTADGKWLFYADNRDIHAPVIMRQSLEGGVAQKVATANVWFDLSPDGRWLVYVTDTAFNVISTDKLQKLSTFPVPSDTQPEIAFSADSKNVYYQTMTGDDTTIWRQPIDSATPVKVSTLLGKRVRWIRPSPDGKKLGLTLATPTSEAILLRDVQ